MHLKACAEKLKKDIPAVYLSLKDIHGLMAIVTQWIGQDCANPMDYVISVMQKYVVQI